MKNLETRLNNGLNYLPLFMILNKDLNLIILNKDLNLIILNKDLNLLITLTEV